MEETVADSLAHLGHVENLADPCQSKNPLSSQPIVKKY